MRDSLLKSAICLTSSKSKEKDKVFVVLSKDNGIDWIVAKSCMSLSKLYIPLGSTSDLYTVSSYGIKQMILKDVRIEKHRDFIVNDYLKFLYFSKLSSFFIKFSKYDKEHSYNIMCDFLVTLENIKDEDEAKMLLCWCIEKYLSCLLYKNEYKRCPICDRVYNTDENIGYSSIISSACCNECADYKNIISPYTRSILDSFQCFDINNTNLVLSSQNKIDNIIKYIQFRLRFLNYEQLYKK